MTSIADLQIIANGDPYLSGLVAKATMSTYEDFLKVLYSDLHHCVKFLETQAHFMEDEDEDSTTSRILSHLNGAGYSASQSNRGGNVDLVVQWTRLGFVWIGEAKKFNSVADLREGYLQLATRYVPGATSTGKSYGGLFGYLRRPNAVKYVEDWKQEFLTLPQAHGAIIRPCDKFGPFAFYSEHNHQSSGTPFEVWHVCLRLFFFPQDASGVSSKKGAQRAANFATVVAGQSQAKSKRRKKPKP